MWMFPPAPHSQEPPPLPKKKNNNNNNLSRSYAGIRAYCLHVNVL